ncbi:MAG: flagellar biosynthetic protein FliR [Candidatus Eremiobacteraeota bacterium]|nr:flagellar biosynthetic protein FliR [Candidatus Eremiobacteraeota bacterium]
MSASGALILARCIGFVSRAPGFSHPSVPAPVRAAFAFVLALACAHGRHDASMPWAAFVPACFVELLLGAAIGMAASALYDGAYSGGRLVDDYVGIRISVPTAGIVAGAGFGRLWSLVFTAMYFILGAHRTVLRVFGETFATLPPGSAVVESFGDTILTIPMLLLRASLLIATPALGVALIAQVALGALARIVPRFATFPLTFPIALGCAILATVVTLPAMLFVAGRPWMLLGRLTLR